jgi:hypothetical protein
MLITSSSKFCASLFKIKRLFNTKANTKCINLTLTTQAQRP